MQIGSDHRRIAGVSIGQHDPVIYRSLFGILLRVPEGGLPAGVGAMPVQDDAQPDLTAVGDNLIHDLQSVEPLQFRIRRQVEVNTVGHAAGIKSLVAEWQPNGVEAETLDLIEHRFISPGPQPVRREIGSLEPEPVDSRYSNRLIIGIEYTITLRVPKSRSGGLRDGTPLKHSHHQPHDQGYRENQKGS